MKIDIYEKVTDAILVQLEKGAAPWVKPWRSVPGLGIACNAVTNRPYSGSNVFMLIIAQELGGYSTSRWLTFRQAKAAGGSVREGEKGTLVSYVNTGVKEVEGTDELRTFPIHKHFYVFNVAQCDGLPDSIVIGDKHRVERTEHQRNEWIDAFVIATGATILRGGEAYYREGSDDITMPSLKSFKSAETYYATLFHELGHWTGHKSRLKRDLSKRFGTQAYAAEELVAELSSAFLCAEFEIDGDLRHAGYIENWITLLKKDKKAFITAASQAQKAVDFMRELALIEQKEVA